MTQIAKDLTAAALFSKWLEFKAISICNRTIEFYRPTVSDLLFFFDDKPIYQIRKVDAVSYLQFILKRGNASETVKRKLESICACWNWAVEFELVTYNPWVGLTKLIKTEKPSQVKPFTRHEIVAILKAFDDSRYKQLLPFVRFLFLTGFRFGEAAGLMWSDITPDFKVVTVRSQLTRSVRKVPKNGRVRSFQFSDDLICLLLEIKQNQKNLPVKSNLVFNYCGEPISDNTFYQIWRKVLKRANVRYRKPYNTRATFISHSLQQGLSPVDVSVLCGNSPRVIYEHYAGSVNTIKLPNLNLFGSQAI